MYPSLSPNFLTLCSKAATFRWFKPKNPIWEDNDKNAKPGQFIKLDEFIHVKCGEGVLLIKELQMPGGKRLKSKEFILGHRPILGDVFKS